MSNNLFRIGTGKDVYWTIDLWALLSPRLAWNGRDQSSLGKNDYKGSVETIEGGRNIYVG